MQWSSQLCSEHKAHSLTLVIKLGHAAPPLFELDTEAPFGASVLGSFMKALGLGKAPFDSPFKLTFDVGDHGGWVSIHHVITIEALSMGDPYPP